MPASSARAGARPTTSSSERRENRAMSKAQRFEPHPDARSGRVGLIVADLQVVHWGHLRLMMEMAGNCDTGIVAMEIRRVTAEAGDVSARAAQLDPKVRLLCSGGVGSISMTVRRAAQRRAATAKVCARQMARWSSWEPWNGRAPTNFTRYCVCRSKGALRMGPCSTSGSTILTEASKFAFSVP